MKGKLQKRSPYYMKPLKNKVSITLDADVIEKIKTLAEKDDRSFSQYINMILKEHLAGNQEHPDR